MTPAGLRPERSSDNPDDAVSLLFSLVGETLGWATSALLDQDSEGARRVISGDEEIDRLCEEVTAALKERLAEASADPGMIENYVSIMQIVPELERSADLAKHIARRSLEGLGGVITPRSRGLIQAVSEITLRMWRVAGEAYVKRSRDAAFRLEESDNELDDLCAALVAEGLSQGEDPKISVDLALIARFYERLGDHAVNLCHRIDAMAAPRRLVMGVATVPSLASFTSSEPAEAGRLARLRAGLRHLRLVPRDNRFYACFAVAAANARECAEEVHKLASSSGEAEPHFERIRELERKGDALTVDLLRLLDTSFVPPFDREDIHALAEEIDDVLDDMLAAASLMQIARVDKPLPEVLELTELLVAMAEELAALIEAMRSKEGARFRLERIEQLEHQGDAVFRRAMAHLFSGDYEALEVIKWKDVVQSLEDSLNAIEEVSDVVESILVKDS